jgi:hypothetical protein
MNVLTGFHHSVKAVPPAEQEHEPTGVTAPAQQQ